MIYDTLDNLNQYTGLFENLDTAIAYLETHNLAELPLGRTEIDGDKVYVNVMEADPTPAEGRFYEVHSRYMDLQTDLEGTELCEVALGELEEEKPYDEAADAAFVRADTSAGLVLCEGRFVLFMVEEPHMPTLKAQGCDHVKKAVVKIAY